MKFWYDGDGRIIQASMLDSGMSMLDDDPAAMSVIGPSVGDLNLYHVVNGEVVELPVRPSENHHFDYQTKTWVLDEEQAWASLRRDRDRRLAATDWVVLRAADTGQPVPPEWLAYRQALRDITEQADPLNIVWPTPPEI